MILQTTLYHTQRRIREFFEDQWFDWTRRVHTSGDLSLALAAIPDTRDSEHYVPARPAHIREALRALPLADPSPYTYIDLGSGKGRTLFIAAELPFRQILGVELSPKLHTQARANIRTFRSKRARCAQINSIHANAADFQFPDTPLVLYLFNPFGPATMQQVLDHLQTSLHQHPRHAVVVLLWPRAGEQVARLKGMRLVSSTARSQTFEVNAPRGAGSALGTGKASSA